LTRYQAVTTNFQNLTAVKESQNPFFHNRLTYRSDRSSTPGGKPGWSADGRVTKINKKDVRSRRRQKAGTSKQTSIRLTETKMLEATSFRGAGSLRRFDTFHFAVAASGVIGSAK
jgi:hypothetical protein